MTAAVMMAWEAEQLSLSQWHGEDVPRPCVGVWLTRTAGNESGEGFQHWNGQYWGLFSANAVEAFNDRDHRSSFQNNEWRGLAANPAEAAK